MPAAIPNMWPAPAMRLPGFTPAICNGRYMAKLIFGMNVSLDGYVDHEAFAPGPDIFRHWIERVRASSGSVYGRRMYEIMRYWDDDRPEWSAELREFALAWRN